MSSVDTCINKINNNTNYNDLQQQITTKGPYLYTFNTINNRSDKLYPDNPTIKFQKNGYLDNNYNNLVDKHSLLLNLDNKLTKDLDNNLSNNLSNNHLPVIDDTSLYTEPTNLNTNVCGLKEFGINRWYNLYKDPTINSIEPFNRIGINTNTSVLDEYSKVCDF